MAAFKSAVQWTITTATKMRFDSLTPSACESWYGHQSPDVAMAHARQNLPRPSVRSSSAQSSRNPSVRRRLFAVFFPPHALLVVVGNSTRSTGVCPPPSSIRGRGRVLPPFVPLKSLAWLAFFFLLLFSAATSLASQPWQPLSLTSKAPRGLDVHHRRQRLPHHPRQQQPRSQQGQP